MSADNSAYKLPLMRHMTLSARNFQLAALMLLCSGPVAAAPAPDAEMSAAGTAIASAERAQPQGPAMDVLSQARERFAQAQDAMARRNYRDAARLADEAQRCRTCTSPGATGQRPHRVDGKTARNADLRRQLMVLPDRNHDRRPLFARCRLCTASMACLAVDPGPAMLPARQALGALDNDPQLLDKAALERFKAREELSQCRSRVRVIAATRWSWPMHACRRTGSAQADLLLEQSAQLDRERDQIMTRPAAVTSRQRGARRSCGACSARRRKKGAAPGPTRRAVQQLAAEQSAAGSMQPPPSFAGMETGAGALSAKPNLPARGRTGCRGRDDTRACRMRQSGGAASTRCPDPRSPRAVRAVACSAGEPAIAGRQAKGKRLRVSAHTDSQGGADAANLPCRRSAQRP